MWLSTDCLKLLSTLSQELAYIFAYPFWVTEAIGPVAVFSALSSDWPIHDVFHIS